MVGTIDAECKERGDETKTWRITEQMPGNRLLRTTLGIDPDSETEVSPVAHSLDCETDASPATIAAEGKEVKPATESADGTDDPSLEVAQTAAESQAPAGEHSATSAQGEGLVADVQVADADGGDPSAEPESS